MSDLLLDVQHRSRYAVPAAAKMRHWLKHVLHVSEKAPKGTCRLSVCSVNSTEMRALNMRYRGKNSATNVLSFSAETPPNAQEILLGDVVVCPNIIRTEARRYHISVNRRWAHILIHGLLHLLSYDHKYPPGRQHMEALEKRIMRHLGYPNPYLTSR